jgi:hypothetical protein
MDISTTPEPKIQKEQKVEKDTKEPIYTNKISLEEYAKQKDDFTQKALKELSEQMKTFVKPKENKEEKKIKSKSVFNIINTSKKINTDIVNDNNNDDNDDDDINDYNNGDGDNDDGNDGSESDYDTNLDNKKPSKSSINLIVQHVENKQKKRKVSHSNSKNQDNLSMSDSIYAQHEVDMQTIQLLKDKMNELKIENADLDSKKHYLTLDLNNAQCEINDLKKQVSYLKDQLISYKQFIKQMKKYDDDFAKMLKYIAIGILLFSLYYIKFLLF